MEAALNETKISKFRPADDVNEAGSRTRQARREEKIARLQSLQDQSTFRYGSTRGLIATDANPTGRHDSTFS